jgi:hypothetical protein
MKIVELLNKLQLPITNEEADVLGKFEESPIIDKLKLSEREQVIANQLVNKDVLYRRHENGHINYRKKI